MAKISQIFDFRIVIYSISVVAAMLTFLLAYLHIGKDSEAFQENLWIGLFCSAVQVCFVVLIIENLMKRDQSNRTRPARAAAFRHALMIYGRSKLLWQNMVQSAFEKTPNLSLLDERLETLVDDRFVPLVAQLDLSSFAPVVPPQPWRGYLLSAVIDIQSQIGLCLARYSAHMEPELIFALQELENTPPFMAFVKIHQSPTLLPMFGNRIPFMDASLIQCILRLGKALESQIDDVRSLLPDGTRLDDACGIYIRRMREKASQVAGAGSARQNEGVPNSGSD